MPIIISGKGYISKALAEVIAQAKADGIEIIYQDSPEPTTPTTMKNILPLILGLFGNANLRAPVIPPTYSHSKGRIRSNQRQKRKARRQAFANGNNGAKLHFK